MKETEKDRIRTVQPFHPSKPRLTQIIVTYLPLQYGHFVGEQAHNVVFPKGARQEVAVYGAHSGE